MAKEFKLLAQELNSTVGRTEAGTKSSKAQGEIDLWLKNGETLDLSLLHELLIKTSWDSPAILPDNQRGKYVNA